MSFSCICCGTCCRKYQPRLTATEVSEIAGQLNITSQEFLAAYTDRRWPGTESFLLMHINAACVFLETTPETHLSLCRIHSFKPACCREWEAGIHKPECQTGLSKLLGIKVDSSLNLAANEEQLRRLAERTKAIGDLTDD